MEEPKKAKKSIKPKKSRKTGKIEKPDKTEKPGKPEKIDFSGFDDKTYIFEKMCRKTIYLSQNEQPDKRIKPTFLFFTTQIVCRQTIYC